MPATATLTTAAELLDALRPLCPSVTGTTFSLANDPPPELGNLLDVLHTGIRAQLAGRPWYGCGSTREHAAPIALRPGLPIPVGITLLCVAGDERWHRIPATAREDAPFLFGAPPAPKPTRKRPDHATD